MSRNKFSETINQHKNIQLVKEMIEKKVSHSSYQVTYVLHREKMKEKPFCLQNTEG